MELTFLTTHLYFVGCVLFGVVWLLCFLRSKSQRIDMLFMGLVFGLLAVPIAHYFALLDYWTPNYLFPSMYLEDFLYGFFFGGILAGWQAKLTPIQFERSLKNTSIDWILIIVPLPLIVITFYVTTYLGLNSITAHIMPPFMIALYIGYTYPHLIRGILCTAFFGVLVTTVIFLLLLLMNPNFISETWHLENLSGYLILGIPLEEYIFAFVLGAATAYFFPATFFKESLKR